MRGTHGETHERKCAHLYSILTIISEGSNDPLDSSSWLRELGEHIF